MSYIQRLLDKKKNIPEPGTGETGETPISKVVDSPSRVPAKPAKPSSAGFAGSHHQESPGFRAEPPAPIDPPWTPRRPPAVVAEIGAWPIPWRQRWGRLSNELEDQGAPFPESERRAYHQVKTEMEARRP